MNTQKSGQGEILTVGNEDNFFAPIGNTKPFIKIAAQGFAGSGKTYTLAQIAVGLHKKIGSKKPIVVFDTEESSKFLLPLFNQHGIAAVNRRSRSLTDLKETFKRCREGFSDILLIDSISHVWENFLEAYKKQKNRTRLEFQDWGVLKPTWKLEFSDPFVRDPYHTLMTGRAGYEYESEIDDETKKRTIYKSGVKMKVEGETAYEPDILIYLERFEHILDDHKEVYRQATVLKDRSTLTDGKTFRNPSYEHFAPAIGFILDAPSKNGATPMEGDDAMLIKKEDDKREYFRQRDIELEKIKGTIELMGLGSSAEDKKVKAVIARKLFGTVSATEMERLPVEKLKAGRVVMDEMTSRIKNVEPEERLTFVESYELPKDFSL